jgi:hypothetical protein
LCIEVLQVRGERVDECSNDLIKQRTLQARLWPFWEFDARWGLPKEALSYFLQEPNPNRWPETMKPRRYWIEGNVPTCNDFRMASSGWFTPTKTVPTRRWTRIMSLNTYLPSSQRKMPLSTPKLAVTPVALSVLN